MSILSCVLVVSSPSFIDRFPLYPRDMFGIAPFVTLVSAAALAAPALAAPAKRQTIYSGDGAYSILKLEEKSNSSYRTGTYFDVALGACGITNVATDMVVAVSELMYDTWP